MKLSNKQLVLSGILAAFGIVISIVENMLPPIFTFAPGAKLGLANIVTMLSLACLPLGSTFAVVVTRVLAASLITGTMSSFMYSFSGAVLSLVVMVLTKKLAKSRVSMIGISVMGGIAHNCGQLLVASLMARSWLTFNYLPFMSLAGILAGFLVGFLANLLLDKLASHIELNPEYYEYAIGGEE